MAWRSTRVHSGTLGRFDSVPEILAFCHRRYSKAEVTTADVGDEFVLRVRNSDIDFESLIVHFEGSRIYAVMFPALDGEETEALTETQLAEQETAELDVVTIPPQDDHAEERTLLGRLWLRLRGRD